MWDPPKRAAMTSIGVSKIIFNPLISLQLIADTGMMTPIGVRKFGCDNIDHLMLMQILCTPAQANLTLTASVSHLPSYGGPSRGSSVHRPGSEDHKLPEPLYQPSLESISLVLPAP